MFFMYFVFQFHKWNLKLYKVNEKTEKVKLKLKLKFIVLSLIRNYKIPYENGRKKSNISYINNRKLAIRDCSCRTHDIGSNIYISFK